MLKQSLLLLALSTLAACSPVEAVDPVAPADPDADILAWARAQYGASLFEPIDTFHGDFTDDGADDALAWVLYASGGNSHFLDVALFRNEAGRLIYHRSVADVFGGNPRNVVFAPNRITLTSTMPLPDDPRCCPTGAQDWTIDTD